jgi:hypothetical protein
VSAPLALLLVAVSSAASAQSSTGDRRWEIEFTAGGACGGPPAGPCAATTRIGLPINLGTATTRPSSWVIGDGAMLPNQALSSFRVSTDRRLTLWRKASLVNGRPAPPSDSAFRGH